MKDAQVFCNRRLTRPAPRKLKRMVEYIGKVQWNCKI